MTLNGIILSADGLIKHCARDARPDGTAFWQIYSPPHNPLGARQTYTSVACTPEYGLGLSDNFQRLHIAATTSTGRIFYTQSTAGQYLPTEDVGELASQGIPRSGKGSDRNDGIPFSRVTLAIESLYRHGRPNAVHLFAITGDGRILRASRSGEGRWSPFRDVEIAERAGERGEFTTISAYALRDDPGSFYGGIQLCATTANGQLWHSIRTFTSGDDPDAGHWSGFGDVVHVVTGRPGALGDVVDVSCCDVGTALHVVASTGDGRIWQTRRFHSNGAWSSFTDIEFIEGDGVRVGRDIGTIRRASVAPAGEGQSHVCAVTSNGRLWYARLNKEGIWRAPFIQETEIPLSTLSVREIALTYDGIFP